MGSHVGIVHLNGKAYDTKTGQPVALSVDSTERPKHKPGRSVDGFYKVKTPVKHTPKPKTEVRPAAKTEVKHTLPHKQQRSKTLMRRAVTKPASPIQKPDVAVAEVKPASQPVQEAPTDDRYKRALSVKKSSLISKFAHQAGKSTVEKKTIPLPVKQAPAHHSQMAARPVQMTQVASVAPKQTAAEEHFNRALGKAEAHKSEKKKAKKHHKVARKIGVSPRALNTAGAVLAFVLLAGFFAYQNIPNISMRIAASRAGFSAQLPEYQPGGFALSGPIKYEPGKITVGYHSNSDEREFAITQQVSGWNSEALADNYLKSNNKEYQTYQDKGRTIYLYDNANATWVNGGIWYQIDGSGVLNNEQLIRVASSL